MDIWFLTPSQPQENRKNRKKKKKKGTAPPKNTPTYGYDVSAQAMGRVGALQHRAELGVAHAGLLARGADGAGSDAHLDDVRPRQDQLLHHLPRHHVARLPSEKPRPVTLTVTGNGKRHSTAFMNKYGH